jgi:serpin B
VNEQGTVATAATGLTMRVGGRPQQPTVVLADRPFLFLVRDRETNAILFMGRLVSP